MVAAPSTLGLFGCGGPQPLAGKQVTRFPVRDHGLNPAFTKCLSSFELTANLKNNPPLRHDPLKFPGAMAIQLPLPRRLNVYRSSALLLILANTFHPTRSVHTALPGVPQKNKKTDEPEPDWTLTDK